MADRAVFVDFMYAVTVGATLPRIDEKALHLCAPVLWGTFFLIVVFLEDFYFYHTKVAPHLAGFPKWRGFILSMLIIGSWYLSQAAFPSNPRLFLASFALFFLFKAFGGLLMKSTKYPSRLDLLFLLPVTFAVLSFVFADHVCFVDHPGRFLWVLAPIWFLSVLLWWLIDTAKPAAEATAA